MAELCVFHGEALGRYAFGDPHPFGVGRLTAFWDEFRKRRLDERAEVLEPVSCEEKDLLSFHTPGYLRRVKEASRLGVGYLDYGDTPAFEGVFEIASTVVGTTLRAAQLLFEGKHRRAFQPIGGLHHARRDRAGGFCVFNDIGVAIEWLRGRGIRRIAYVDIDAHHGDGVYYEYESDPELWIGDTHQDGRTLYPGTGFSWEKGKGAAEGTKLNFPLAPGAGESEFFEAFDRIEEFLDESKPEFFLLQCGADSIDGDPLAQLQLTPRCHREAATRLRVLADKHAQGRLLAMGGGGYDLGNLAETWSEVVFALV